MVHHHLTQCLLMNSYSTMTCDDVARRMCCSMVDHTCGRVPKMVTKSLCPDDSFHRKMTMHSLTETVKRNLNFESDWVVGRGGVFVKHRSELLFNNQLSIFINANHFQFKLQFFHFECTLLFPYRSGSSKHHP